MSINEKGAQAFSNRIQISCIENASTHSCWIQLALKAFDWMLTTCKQWLPSHLVNERECNLCSSTWQLWNGCGGIRTQQATQLSLGKRTSRIRSSWLHRVLITTILMNCSSRMGTLSFVTEPIQRMHYVAAYPPSHASMNEPLTMLQAGTSPEFWNMKTTTGLTLFHFRRKD